MITDPDGAILGRTPGLPDDVFEHDGLITKRHIRASALALLRPRAGEWCRAADGARAVAVERVPERAARVAANAVRLAPAGAVRLVESGVAEAPDGLPRPDAVFIGGGATSSLVERAVEALPGGGRIVVPGVTVVAEEVCVAAYRRWGGQLARLHHEHAAPIGRLLGWTPARAVVSWGYVVEGSR